MNEMIRVGIGYDIHPLAKGRALILGGVQIPYELGLLGDSDADVLVHAIIDAILGATGEGDIGRVFGVGVPRLKGISSLSLLDEVRGMLEHKGLRIGNVDAVVIAERPRLSPYLEEMKRNIERTLRLEGSSVNIKATTAKGLGIIGRGKGICVQAIVCVSSTS
jgi:2-C-methyl-D-erythritol 2,4-cyclodiphosphate synthase